MVLSRSPAYPRHPAALSWNIKTKCTIRDSPRLYILLLAYSKCIYPSLSKNRFTLAVFTVPSSNSTVKVIVSLICDKSKLRSFPIAWYTSSVIPQNNSYPLLTVGDVPHSKLLLAWLSLNSFPETKILLPICCTPSFSLFVT